MSAEIVLQQMIIIFLLIMTGYIVYKRGIIQNNVAKGISALVVNVCNPALLIRSAFDHDASITYDKILYAVVGGAVLYAVLILASLFLPKPLKKGDYRLTRAMYETAQDNCLPTPKEDIDRALDEWETKFNNGLRGD